MKVSYRTAPAVRLLSVLLSGVLLSGCAGPSTRVLIRESGGQTFDTPEEILVLEEVNPFYLQEELNILTASPRTSGSRGESDAARYMQQLLRDYGYEVDRQRFRYENGETVVTGTNVIAVRQAPSSDADILVISTHHDTAPGSPGANNDAAGVVTLLETARLLSRLPTDTELRFLSYSGYETNRLGARYYVDSLSKRERERMIGVVDLNALGYISDEQIVLGTLDGEPTMLGDMLNDAAWDVLGEAWGYEHRAVGAVGSFVAGQVPAVSLMQKREAFENRTPLDTAGIVDIERVSHVVDVVSQMVSRVMSTDTPSMMAKAHFYNDLRDYAYVQKKDTAIRFGAGREETEESVGIHGFRTATNTDEAGRLIEKYQYRMKWFGVDQVILTNLYFTDGKLDSISLEADGAGVDFEDMKERLTDTCGAPAGENDGPNGTEYDWIDPVHRSFFALIPGTDGYDVEIREYSTDKMVLEQRTPEGTVLMQNKQDGRIERVMELFGRIFPKEEWGKIGAVTLYTDGVGGTESYLEPMEPTAAADNGEDGGSESGQAGQSGGENTTEATAPGGENALWELGIDLEDALDESGDWRNETGTVRMLAGLYGRMLEASLQSQYIGMFEERFYGARPEGGEMPGQPEVTRPSGEAQPSAEATVRPGVGQGDVTEADLTPPDFEEAFWLFVLAHRPEHMSGSWSERIGFFYEFEELTEYRSWVRGNLQLQPGAEKAEETAVDTGE